MYLLKKLFKLGISAYFFFAIIPQLFIVSNNFYIRILLLVL